VTHGPETDPRIRRALFAGLTGEGVVLTGGALYLFFTGMYLRPLPWVALVVVATGVGLAVGISAYLKGGRGRT
jgi:hypothetical protein